MAQDQNRKRTDRNPFIIPLAGTVLAIALVQLLATATGLFYLVLSKTVAITILLVSCCVLVAYIIVAIRFENDGEAHKTTPSRFTVTIGILILLIYALLWFLAIVSPDLSWDGNAYHIPPIAMWAQKGFVHWIDTPYLEPLMNGYPKGAELVAYVWVTALGNSVLNTMNLLFLPLGIMGIASLASTLGARTSTALLAGLCYMLIPVNLNQMATTYVDAAFASSAIAMLGLWLHILKHRSIAMLSWSIPYGAAIGLAISVKSTGIALGGLSILIMILLIGFDFYKRKRIKETDQSAIRSSIFGILAAILLLFLTGGFWYLRNAIHTGSPLYPIGLTAFGNTIFPGISISEAIYESGNTPDRILHFPRFLQILYAWLQDIPHWPKSIRGYDTRLAGMGFLWILGCIPAILLSGFDFFRRKRPFYAGYFSLAALVLVVFLMTPMNWWSRYTFWVYAVGLPAFALAVEKWNNSQGILKTKLNFTRAWLGACLLVAAFEGLYCLVDAVALATPGSLLQSLRVFYKPQTWSWTSNYFFPETRGTVLDESINNDNSVAISPRGEVDFTTYTSLVGELSQPIGKRKLFFIDETISRQEITAAGIDRVFWDAAIPLPVDLSGLPYEEVLGFLVITP